MAALLMAGRASAADVRVMISAGFYGVYSELGPAFERASGHHLVTTRGPSMGDSPEAIPARLARGEAADVVILDGGAADELIRRELVRADSKVELARSLIGMVVRAGAEKPDIGSVEALRSTLLAAREFSEPLALDIATAMMDASNKPARPVGISRRRKSARMRSARSPGASSGVCWAKTKSKTPMSKKTENWKRTITPLASSARRLSRWLRAASRR